MRAEVFNRLLKTLLDSFPPLTVDEEGLAVHLYRLLSGGSPVTTEKLAASAGLTPKIAEGKLGRWPGVEYNEKKAVTGFWGLGLEETGHHFFVDGRRLYTWCAWDALFLPEILKKTALVESTCPVSGEKIRLTVSPGKIESRLPARAVMSFTAGDPQKVKEAVIPNFCRYVHFFASRKTASLWTAQTKGTFILALDEALDLAGAKNRARYGRALGIVP